MIFCRKKLYLQRVFDGGNHSSSCSLCFKIIAVTSVYIEEAEEVQKEVSVLCDVSYANGRVKFLSKYSVPADTGCNVIRAGVVATDSTGYAAIQEVQQELTLDTTATTRLKNMV